MNLFAGLIGGTALPQERERRLRTALGDAVACIYHLSDRAAVGWVGSAGLTALHQSEHAWALAHGSAYSIRGLLSARADDPNAVARHLLSQTGQNVGEALAGLAGAFIALRGTSEGSCWLASDPSGGRPAFVHVAGSELCVASHPLPCAHLVGDVRIDRSMEDFLLVYGFLPFGRTPFQGVRALPVGSSLQSDGGNWREVPATPPRGPLPPEVPAEKGDLLDGLHDVLLQAVQDQLPLSTEVGVLLGGFDSALVAALLARLGKKVFTYSFRYPGHSEFDQPGPEVLGAFIGARHTWVDITPEVIEQGLARFGEHYIQPTNWLGYLVQTTHVCNQMREEGLSAAFSGDGCDALFLGYPGTYKRTLAFSRLPKLPPALVHLALRAVARPLVDRIVGHPYRLALNALRATARPMPARAALSFRVMDEITVHALRGADHPPQVEPVERLVARLSEAFAGMSIQRLGYAAKALISPNRAKLLACADVAGVRVHSPYMHPMVKAFASRIPDEMLRERSQSKVTDPGKACLMRMAERKGLLPPELIYQPKLAAIDSPIDSWFAGPLRAALDRSFQGLPFGPEPEHLDSLVQTTAAERFYKRHIGSTRVVSDATSLLATYGAVCASLGQQHQPDRD